MIKGEIDKYNNQNKKLMKLYNKDKKREQIQKDKESLQDSITNRSYLPPVHEKLSTLNMVNRLMKIRGENEER